jgi:hypothetical protein
VADSADFWRLHQNAQFPPSCLPLSVDGVRLVKIDAAVGAILTASLRSDGAPRPINESKRLDLMKYRPLIEKVRHDHSIDADGRTYFDRLAILIDLVLKG